MSVFTESEKNFLSSFGQDIFLESSKNERSKILKRTYEILEEFGFTPKISKSSKIGWVNKNNAGTFGESLCISLGQWKGLDEVCSKVNAEIKPLGAMVSPDNYGTIFLSMTDNFVTESYIGNYFRNKILLYKFGTKPELNEKMIVKLINTLHEKYESSLLDDEVKSIKKRKNVDEYYVAQAEMQFPDGMCIEFAFCYDEKSFTPGAAFRDTSRGKYVVLLYPNFFSNPEMDINVFTLMHEIGHIRLGHTDRKNQHPNPNRRHDVMANGNVIYQELNADLYAALNGAKMYTILKEGVSSDKDKKYDYRYTNNEMAKRYSYVFRKFKKLRSMNEDACDDLDMLEADFELMLEAVNDSHIIKEALYGRVEGTLKNPDNDKLFKRYVEDFIDRNSEKLHEPAPISLIPFTDYDKSRFFELFGFTEKECMTILTSAVKSISSTADFKLIRQNPIFSLFYMVLRYYIIKKDEIGINSTLVIHSLASYPSVFSKYFKYGANAGVMRYTVDNLTEKFIFKQEGSIMAALRKSINAAYTFLKPNFIDASDKEVIRYVQRIRNDQNSLIKKIFNEYQKNHRAGKSISTQNETYDTGALIDDYANDTSKVETLTHKVIINMITNGIDLRLLDTAGQLAQLSVSELRLYLLKILVETRTTELEDFVTSVLFLYLYDLKKEQKDIKSKEFLSFGLELFRKTNSNNKNISTIKGNLDKWAEETGIHARYRREPTRISYKKGIYWYIMLTIQMNA